MDGWLDGCSGWLADLTDDEVDTRQRQSAKCRLFIKPNGVRDVSARTISPSIAYSHAMHFLLGT